jgi:uncharacterized protein YdeI (YjbR/CyaY-like superfamily)
MHKLHPNATEEVLQYIEVMPEFSKAICKKLRQIILKADKDIQEDWKWGPNYYCKGMVCGYGAFQKHVKLTFFNGAAMKDERKLFNHCVDSEFSRSIKYTDIAQVDEQAITAYVKESAAVNKSGYKRMIKDKTVDVPEDLQKAFASNKSAWKFFDNLSYGYKKDYVEWVTRAKKDETRTDRINKVVSMCAEERRMNDKYKK